VLKTLICCAKCCPAAPIIPGYVAPLPMQPHGTTDHPDNHIMPLFSGVLVCVALGSPPVFNLCYKEKDKLARVLKDPRMYLGQPRLQTGVQLLALSQVMCCGAVSD
jgi:hypothetical protein